VRKEVGELGFLSVLPPQKGKFGKNYKGEGTLLVQAEEGRVALVLLHGHRSRTVGGNTKRLHLKEDEPNERLLVQAAAMVDGKPKSETPPSKKTYGATKKKRKDHNRHTERNKPEIWRREEVGVQPIHHKRESEKQKEAPDPR